MGFGVGEPLTDKSTIRGHMGMVFSRHESSKATVSTRRNSTISKLINNLRYGKGSSLLMVARK